MRLFQQLNERFDLHTDTDDEQTIIAAVWKGTEFKGANLWVLIFSILIASVGLNVNSTAVIIGAMLISPLMGPIIGIGMSVGIYDFELFRKAFRNLTVAVVISVLTAALYFSVSPLDQAQSELLARTTPTVWDVLIAFFGGMAGMIANTRREKGTAIPGVAIATALMPPLCTAGFGIATGNVYYFLGAFYLFFINSVFIALATFLVVRLLRFQSIRFVDTPTERRIKRLVLLLVLFTAMPSIYLGYRIVQKTIFERNAREFLRREFAPLNNVIIRERLTYRADTSTIDVSVVGSRITPETLQRLRTNLQNYGLTATKIQVRQGAESYVDNERLAEIRSSILDEVYRKSDEQLQSKDERIALLEAQLVKNRLQALPVTDMAAELRAEYPSLLAFTAVQTPIVRVGTNRIDTVAVIYARFRRRPSAANRRRIENWARARTKAQQVKLIID